MLGLNVYSFIDNTNIAFYMAHRILAKKVDILDWLLEANARGPWRERGTFRTRQSAVCLFYTLQS